MTFYILKIALFFPVFSGGGEPMYRRSLIMFLSVFLGSCSPLLNLDGPQNQFKTYAAQTASLQETEALIAYQADASWSVYKKSLEYIGEEKFEPPQGVERSCYYVQAPGRMEGIVVHREKELTDKRIEVLSKLSDLLAEVAATQKVDDDRLDPVTAGDQVLSIYKNLVVTLVDDLAEAGVVGVRIEALRGVLKAMGTAADAFEKRRKSLAAIETLSDPRVRREIQELANALASTFTARRDTTITAYNTWFVCSEAVLELTKRKTNTSGSALFLYVDRRSAMEKDRIALQAQLRKYDGDASQIGDAIRKMPAAIAALVEHAKQPTAKETISSLLTATSIIAELRKQADVLRTGKS